jgi:hypothetical protein
LQENGVKYRHNDINFFAVSDMKFKHSGLAGALFASVAATAMLPLAGCIGETGEHLPPYKIDKSGNMLIDVYGRGVWRELPCSARADGSKDCSHPYQDINEFDPPDTPLLKNSDGEYVTAPPPRFDTGSYRAPQYQPAYPPVAAPVQPQRPCQLQFGPNGFDCGNN